MSLNNNFTKEIPIFFSTDDTYLPFLDIAITSMIENASRDYKYRVIILNTGVKQENAARIMRNANDNFTIEFFDISNDIERIKDKFRNLYHFSVVTYYRLFIASLFPQYDKALYLDCDIVVLGDISELYNIELKGNIIAAAPERFVQTTPEFRKYAEFAVGVDPDTYFNAGILVIDLEQYRAHRIEEKFVELMVKYDFDVLDPDQAYLNYLCRGKIYTLPNGWNKETIDEPCEGGLNIIHYALYKKPWQFDDVLSGEYFWKYAKKSPFYDDIVESKNNFSPEDEKSFYESSKQIVEQALTIVDSDCTFFKLLGE